MRTVSLSAEQLAAVAEVGQVAGEFGALEARAASALDSVLRLTGADCAFLAAWDPVSRGHRPLANAGYSDDVVAYLVGPRFQRDDGYRAIRLLGRPMRQCDIEDAGRREPVRVLRSAGFREGLTHCISTRDGRYVGMLKLSTERPRPVSTDLLLALELLTASLSTLADVTRETQLVASLFPPQMALVLARDDGSVVPLQGRPDSPLLTARSGAVEEARRRAHRTSPARFVVHDERTGSLSQIIGVRVRDEVVVGVHPERPPLTLRELQVATLIATGATNAHIAEQLYIARSTVNRHVEHLLEKLAVHSRAAVAARIVEEGLQLSQRTAACGRNPRMS